jgi:hypothetical protein
MGIGGSLADEQTSLRRVSRPRLCPVSSCSILPLAAKRRAVPRNTEGATEMLTVQIHLAESDIGSRILADRRAQSGSTHHLGS